MSLDYIGQCVEVAFNNLEHIFNEWKSQPTNYHVGFKCNEYIENTCDELELSLRAYRDELIQLELNEEIL